MIAPLLTPAAVAELLGVRDPRTVRRRLAELGVPVIPLGRGYRVRPDDLDAALARAARVEAGARVGEVVRRRSVPARSGPVVRGWWREPLDAGRVADHGS